MALEIANVVPQAPSGSRPGMTPGQDARRAEARADVARVRAQQEQQQQAAQESARQDLERYVQELRTVSRVFDKRLSFSFNEELDRMIVKVIDNETDRVIKELPPDELQRVHLRIREAIGLLLDETA